MEALKSYTTPILYCIGFIIAYILIRPFLQKKRKFNAINPPRKHLSSQQKNSRPDKEYAFIGKKGQERYSQKQNITISFPDFDIRDAAKKHIIDTAVKIIKSYKYDTMINTEIMCRRELQRHSLGLLQGNISQIAKMAARLIDYTTSKYKNAGSLDKVQLSNLLESDYLTCFYPELAKDNESNLSLFGCLAFVLNPIISALIALYLFWETQEFGEAVGIFIACVMFIVPIPLLILKVILNLFVSEEKERRLMDNLMRFPRKEKAPNKKQEALLKTMFCFFVLFIFASAFLLVGAASDSCDLFDGYYMLLRVITCATCVYSAVKFKTEWARWIFGVLAVLYNPVLPVHLGDKDLWSIINLATVVYMWIALFAEGRATKVKNDKAVSQ